MNNIVKEMSSTKSIYHNAIILAKYNRAFPPTNKIRSCYWCGAKEDYITNFVKFIAIYRPDLGDVACMCENHAHQWEDTIWDCFLGEEVPLKNGVLFPLKYRLHRLRLPFLIMLRFIYYFVLGFWGWKVYFPIMAYIKNDS